jgi:hypothetical protein
MKKIRVTFIKIQKVYAAQTSPTILSEQTYITDNNNCQINIPEGFGVLSVCELLPDVTQPKVLSIKN